MIKRALLLFALMLVLPGCAGIPFSRSYEKAARNFREDVIHFYDNVSDAYFILGYEYYELSREFEKKGNPEQAAYYNDKATMYYNLSKDLKNAAAETRHLSQEP
jgi:hypothetical protein